LLKGNVTVVAEPGGPVYLNPAGQSWAATAGSGDVLSGIVGALRLATRSGWAARMVSASASTITGRSVPSVNHSAAAPASS
ncbi:NAD(P)H-hydrate dehydratase, partial [Mycolicibacterium moriokaense]|uniref:NAD(P)H-hydrate dehydratase n=1 Tax=Mycolicibacterium moriokaense TaxID=39691 RepID=UPI003B3B7CC9